MDENTSFRMLLMVVYVCVTMFIVSGIRSCCDYALKSEKQFIDGGYSKQMLPGSEYAHWVK